ncbi:MAG: hypothetical protein JJ868_14725 [Shimia sp.]|uniref:hypothetical protein n=1 Tax=Shimia sp. TaxID=1954381 RepID=UPI001AFDC0F2|nr:hypothetical protein [Shimia sp.]MBO6898624.1 hypothetical protein [Shimia sp.]
MSADLIAEVAQFARLVPKEAIEALFGLTNGVMVARNKFNMFGVLGKRGGGEYAHLPLNINLPNVYERPAELQEGALILAHSSENDNASGHICKYCHYVDGTGVISVPDYNDLSAPVRCYDDVSNWLCSEFETALSSLK